MNTSAILLSLLTLLPLQEQAPSATQILDQGWGLIPAYDGEHRSYLGAEDRAKTEAASHLFAAAATLEQDLVRAHWSLGHAEILLAEDDRNRGRTSAAKRHFEQAVSALQTSLALEPKDPWARYALGTAHAAFGHNEQASSDLKLAVEYADERIASDGEQGSIPWLRFKALQWQPEVQLRAGQFVVARQGLERFHAEFSNNAWPGFIAAAESYNRERDFAGARAQYQSARDSFPSDDQAYALLGYIAGLQNDRELASKQLQAALDRERVPTLYPRLWLWILATDEVRQSAREDLQSFLSNPPDSLPAWDRYLGQFMLSGNDSDSFLAAAAEEKSRRIDAHETVDNLMCEAAFYAGLHLELAAELDSVIERGMEKRSRAQAAYARALEATPQNWKWEWAFARLHFAQLSSSNSSPLEANFQIEGDQIRVGELRGTIERLRWHVPGQEKYQTELNREPLRGDLLMVQLRTDDGRREYVTHVVGLRQN